MDSPKNCVFIPCGHECTWYECANDFLERRPDNQKKCIICRENLKSIIKIYLWYLMRMLKGLIEFLELRKKNMHNIICCSILNKDILTI